MSVPIDLYEIWKELVISLRGDPRTPNTPYTFVGKLSKDNVAYSTNVFNYANAYNELIIMQA